MNVREIEERQSTIKFDMDSILLLLRGAIPLVDANYERSSCFERMTQKMQVLVNQPFVRVYKQQHHMRILNRVERLDDRELLNRCADAAPAPYSGGINKRIGLSVSFKRNVNAVAGGSCLIKHHNALLAQYSVYKGRFADIRTTNDRHFDAIHQGVGFSAGWSNFRVGTIRSFNRFTRFSDLIQKLMNEHSDTVAITRRDQCGFPKP